MRHYHGTPLGGTRDSVARFIATGNRHFLVPFGREEDLPIVAEASTGFCLDNGAFSAWKTGKPIADWSPYYAWVEAWCRNPRFDFAFIPDVIDGTEEENDRLIEEFGCSAVGRFGVPVWHLNESLRRLERLVDDWTVIALGSSGEYAKPKTERWNRRMSDAMGVLCDEHGRPKARLHGLRMLDPAIVARYPFHSADSTNVAQNSQLLARFGMYKPPTQAQRREVIASRIEATRSPSVWTPVTETQTFLELEAE
ncbi:hypothetical protein [Rubripirellula reticaptiva]|uniref:Uncharacterized protein n=1 Tax=Rubripirellula reticaptiva TaxID=2528013 RepID=A0A5C6ECR4_9BACT|nr:hypothetical protein [Rubripirellula reticaptiva]TWU46440.1 hypothetical protein Poly59_53830 [Rubripirellula reticaptiva]